MSTEKRKRSANFSDDEKMRFLRILQKKGKVILTKSTSHDMQTNRLKEEAWTQITNDLNACGNVLRFVIIFSSSADTQQWVPDMLVKGSTHKQAIKHGSAQPFPLHNTSYFRTSVNLKKLWQKLKTEAKTFKAIAYNQAIGTGGGPSKKTDDPVLELVAEITGRATTGIESVVDCDSGMSYINTELDPKKKLIFCHTSTPTPSKGASEDTNNNRIPLHASASIPIVVQHSDGSQSVADEEVSYFEVQMEEAENVPPTVTPMFTPKRQDAVKKNLKRRRPLIDHGSNERSAINAARVCLNNNYADERIRCEKAKSSLIALQNKHMLELHALKIDSIKKQTELKTSILEAILKKIQDEKPVDPELVKLALSNNE